MGRCRTPVAICCAATLLVACQPHRTEDVAQDDASEVSSDSPTTAPEVAETEHPTRWRELPVPARYGQAGRRFASPEAVLGALLGDTVSLRSTDGARRAVVWTVVKGRRMTGVIRQEGFYDDAVTGSEMRVHLARRSGGWHVAAMAQRDLCSRGVSGNLCL